MLGCAAVGACIFVVFLRGAHDQRSARPDRETTSLQWEAPHECPPPPIDFQKRYREGHPDDLLIAANIAQSPETGLYQGVATIKWHDGCEWDVSYEDTDCTSVVNALSEGIQAEDDDHKSLHPHKPPAIVTEPQDGPPSPSAPPRIDKLSITVSGGPGMAEKISVGPAWRIEYMIHAKRADFGFFVGYHYSAGIRIDSFGIIVGRYGPLACWRSKPSRIDGPRVSLCGGIELVSEHDTWLSVAGATKVTIPLRRNLALAILGDVSVPAYSLPRWPMTEDQFRSKLGGSLQLGIAFEMPRRLWGRNRR